MFLHPAFPPPPRPPLPVPPSTHHRPEPSLPPPRRLCLCPFQSSLADLFYGAACFHTANPAVRTSFLRLHFSRLAPPPSPTTASILHPPSAPPRALHTGCLHSSISGGFQSALAGLLYAAADKVIDKDGTGYVVVADLKHILTSIGEKLEPAEFDEWIREIDVGSDGKIKYDDFIARMVAK